MFSGAYSRVRHNGDSTVKMCQSIRLFTTLFYDRPASQPVIRRTTLAIAQLQVLEPKL